MLVMRLTYYAIVVLCIGISVILTYLGFKTTFGEYLAAAFTAVIALGLFTADYLIQRYREIGLPLGKPFIIFATSAFFSVLSNFNFLYTPLTPKPEGFGGILRGSYR